MSASWTFAIDRGGTFTDIVAHSSDGAVRVDLLDERVAVGDVFRGHVPTVGPVRPRQGAR